MLGGMTNIVFDDEGMEGSKSNLIIVYDEPEDSEGLIRNNKDVCAHCNQQGHQQEDLYSHAFVSTLPNLCLDKTSIVYPC